MKQRRIRTDCLRCSHCLHLIQFGPLPVGGISLDVVGGSGGQIWFSSQHLRTKAVILTQGSTLTLHLFSQQTLTSPPASSPSRPPRRRHKLWPSRCARCHGYLWPPGSPSASQSGCSRSRTTDKSPVRQEKEHHQVKSFLKAALM